MNVSSESGALEGTPYARLRELGIILPPPPPPVGNFVPAVEEGSLLFLSGQGPVQQGRRYTGKVGGTVTLEEAYLHARIAGINLLAVMHAALGSLARVRRIVKLFGMVNATQDFANHPAVINGCSDLLVAVFGNEIGRHARSAVGVSSLPGQISVEIELIAAVTSQPTHVAVTI
jgi:enamine deaminase RidA (YjgF/YER057c/UK114 family)